MLPDRERVRQSEDDEEKVVAEEVEEQEEEEEESRSQSCWQPFKRRCSI